MTDPSPTFVLTGATSGIGEQAAHRLAATAGSLIILGPEPESAVSDVLAGIRSAGEAKVQYISADFTDLSEVERAASDIRALAPHIDVLINNAGVPGEDRREITQDGFEHTLQVNYLAMVLLTVGLRESLDVSSRIVNVGSGTHFYVAFDFDDLQLEHGYSPAEAYYRSKLAVVTYSLWLATTLEPKQIKVVTVCPGLTDTRLIDRMFGRMGAPAAHGADNVVAAALAELPTGVYLQDGEEILPSDEASDAEKQHELLRRTEWMLGLQGLSTGRIYNRYRQ